MSVNEFDSERTELLSGFVVEGRDMLDEVEPLLIELEKEADLSGEVDPEVINTIFRLFHSLKGGAGFLELNSIAGVTHEAETLLDLFRKNEAVLSSEHIDLWNRTCDFIRQLFDLIETNLSDEGLEDEADEIINELIQIIDSIKSPAEMASDEKLQLSDDSMIEDIDEVNKDSVVLEEPVDQFKLTITPEMVKQFTSEGAELLDAAEQSLLQLEKDSDNEELVSQAFRSLHSFKGNSGFFNYSDMEKLSHQAENILDSIRESRCAGDSKIFTLLLEIIDFLRDALRKVDNGLEPKIPALSGLISLLTESATELNSNRNRNEHAVDSNARTASEESTETSNNDKDTTEQSEIGLMPLGDEAISLNYRNGTDRRINTEQRKEKVQQRTLDKRKANRRKAPVERRLSDKMSSMKQSVRVDVDKLDKLLNLVGELVIAEAMVAQNQDIIGLDVSMENFERSVIHLDKLTRDLHDLASSVRMIPLASTFRRMIRLVRDLAQKAEKKIELQLVGEDTEVDKTIIENINDPLVHVIRNAIDHGIGTPSEREKTGKTSTGTITLEAKYVGSEVWITIKDNGKGLNREKIINRAIERELISGDGSDLRDDEVWQFIFHPGFSTAEKITDISGRGVGMDVVKRNLEGIRGRVDVRSVQGNGTEVILRIPLTLATIDGMIIRVGNTKYTIPIVAIRKSLQIDEKQITIIPDGMEIAKIRDELIPVVRLHEFFGIEAEYTDLNEGILIMVENDGNSICLFVDDVIGQQQVVIKAIPVDKSDLHGVSGCTIMGDGSICLIIDIAGLMQSTFSKNTAVEALTL
ncbi:MAG: chemotaxis protein CheA [Calditrichaeota bacterium]|nr:chemotaxis protein CheA [Calditrichota bacterium]